MFILSWLSAYYALYYFPKREPGDWPFWSRILSILNSLLVYVLASSFLYLEGWAENSHQCFYTFPLIKFLLYSFRAYLLVDLSFFLISIVQRRTDWNRGAILNIIHHLTGLLSMQAFIIADAFYINVAYYALTELSTIPLHMAWIFSSQNLTLANPQDYKFLMMSYGLLAYLVFFIIRILGALLLWKYYILTDYGKEASKIWWQFILMWAGNGLLTILNFVWFYMMSKLLYKKLYGKTKK